MDKKTIIVLALLLPIFFAWHLKQNRNLNKPNWQWSDDWGSVQLRPVEQPISPDKTQQQLIATDFDNAKTLAAQHNKPILIVFSASWCSWCKKLEKETLSSPQIRAQLLNYVFLNIDTDKEKELVQQLDIKGLPTMAIADSSGMVKKSEAGFMDVAKMKAFLQ